MEILFVASEVAPFSKTGGLGDVLGALPQALAALGHSVAVVTPRYGTIDPVARRRERLDGAVRIHGQATTVWVAPGRAPVYFVEHEGWFGSRKALYGERGHDYADNAQRFAFFARAALALPAALGRRPRIVHLNDWQAGLAPWLLRHDHEGDPALARAKSVFTIHNLAYQGVFPKATVPALGLPWEVFRWDAMEFHDSLNFLKAGLAFADALTTVSPTYAKEILGPEQGFGLDPLLRHRAADLTGILNGIDVHLWDPRTDPHLYTHYSAEDLAGKAACKAALQRELGLPVRADAPLLAVVSRLAAQKGLDLLAAILPTLLRKDLQLVVLGSGAPEYETLFAHLARERPDRMAARIGFDEPLAHRIEAGADLFLMPSRYEPCGLNQMYSLRYGTVPVVRAVGGLDDTVEDYDGWRQGTGFKFRELTPEAFLVAVQRALDAWRDARAWRELVRRGMAEDNSWEHSARAYEALYERLADGR
ncbi:MAG TPA: glycogen synthase GlgA [Anaeromyxobacteraceae bacterium]|nr:glycogen synthase GlgA [Anaeromyxobacteraceae bacterium]